MLLTILAVPLFAFSAATVADLDRLATVGAYNLDETPAVFGMLRVKDDELAELFTDLRDGDPGAVRTAGETSGEAGRLGDPRLYFLADSVPEAEPVGVVDPLLCP